MLTIKIENKITISIYCCVFIFYILIVSIMTAEMYQVFEFQNRLKWYIGALYVS